MTDLESERDKEMVRNRTRGMEKSDWQRSKEQDILVSKINIKGEWKGVRHAEKKRLREGERESTGKKN